MAVIEATDSTETAPGCCGPAAPPRMTLADKARGIIREAGVPVWGMAVIMLALAVMTDGQASASALFTLDAFVGILPFILASVVIAAGLKAAGADNMVASAVTARPAMAIFTASLFGALSPFWHFARHQSAVDRAPCQLAVPPFASRLAAAAHDFVTRHAALTLWNASLSSFVHEMCTTSCLFDCSRAERELG